MSETWSDNLRYRMVTILIIFFVALGYYIRQAFGPLIVAALIAYLMNPVVEWISKHPRLSRKAGVNVVFLGVLALLIAVPSTFLPTIIRQLETFSKELRNIYTLVVDYIATPIQILEWTFEPQLLLPAMEEIPFLNVGFLTGEAFHLIESITVNTLWLLVILVVIYFLLLDGKRLKNFIFSLAPQEHLDDLQRLLAEVVVIWNAYLRGNLILMLITAILFSITWSIIGLPAGILLGIMMGLFSIVPDVGAMAAAGITVLVAFLEGSAILDIPNIWFAVLVFVIYFVLINVKNLWLRSILFGRSVHMHEGLVFILIMLAVLIQGILGAIIVIPLAASGMVVLRYLLRKVYKQPGFTTPPQPEIPPAEAAPEIAEANIQELDEQPAQDQ